MDLLTVGGGALCAVALGLRAHHAGTVAEQHRREAEDLMDFMVGDLADKLRPLGRLDLLAGIRYTNAVTWRTPAGPYLILAI